MKQIALLGVGRHSRNEHIPALKHLLEARGDLRVAAVCDLDQIAASEVANQLHAPIVSPNLSALLETPGIDGIIAVTPTPLTCELTSRILGAGTPVLMEKPLGTSLDEADQIVKVAQQTGTPVMVGMNRRHDPVMKQVRDWSGQHTITYARASIRRKNRREEGFIEDAALHPVDLLCSILGPGSLERFDPIGPGCAEAGIAHLQFGSVSAVLEILPACGIWEESYQFSGDGFSIHAHPQQTAQLMQEDETVSYSAPEGQEGKWTTGETHAFLDALHGNAPWTPTPSDVRSSMRLTQQIAEAILREEVMV